MKENKKQLNILYVSSACSKEVYNNLQNKIISPMQYSIQKFHNLIIKGISKNKNIKIEALTGIPVNRKKTKKVIFKKQITLLKNIRYIHVGFINLPILKQFITNINMIINLLKWNKKGLNKIIICDAAYVTVTPIIVFLSKILKIKIIAIVADIYGYMSDKLIERGRIGIIKKIITKMCNYCWKNYDGYILLTEQMNNIVNPNNKPFIIMEGISSIENENVEKLPKCNYIMYAGGLHEEYGIKELVDGFNMIENEEIELYLYGQGNAIEYIKEMSKKNKRIKYMGTKSNEEIIIAEKKAKLLINPRPTKGEFTLYSFPSKTIEYMLTGTPVIMTKLPGMPKEYEEYVYLIEEENAIGIKNAIENVINLKEEELEQRGEKSREFILKNKNNEVQGKRILKLIAEIIKNDKK